MRLISATSLALVFAMATAFTVPATGEELQMPAAGAVTESLPPPPADAMELPDKGMSKEEVKQMFGVPNVMEPAVGDPPISRWLYGQYTVYFEGNYVIHTVVNDNRRFTE